MGRQRGPEREWRFLPLRVVSNRDLIICLSILFWGWSDGVLRRRRTPAWQEDSFISLQCPILTTHGYPLSIRPVEARRGRAFLRNLPPSPSPLLPLPPTTRHRLSPLPPTFRTLLFSAIHRTTSRSLAGSPARFPAPRSPVPAYTSTSLAPTRSPPSQPTSCRRKKAGPPQTPPRMPFLSGQENCLWRTRPIQSK